MRRRRHRRTASELQYGTYTIVNSAKGFFLLVLKMPARRGGVLPASQAEPTRVAFRRCRDWRFTLGKREGQTDLPEQSGSSSCWTT